MTEREMRDELMLARLTLKELKEIAINTGEMDVATFNRVIELLAEIYRRLDRIDAGIVQSTSPRDIGGVMTDPVF